MANCALAKLYSRAGIVHSFSVRFKTRNSTFIAFDRPRSTPSYSRWGLKSVGAARFPVYIQSVDADLHRPPSHAMGETVSLFTTTFYRSLSVEVRPEH